VKEEYFLTHFDVVIKRELSGRKTVLIIVLDRTLFKIYSSNETTAVLPTRTHI